MGADTDLKAKLPLPGWLLVLVALGFGRGGAVAGVRGLTTAGDNSERVRALGVRQHVQEKQLEKMDLKLDKIVDDLHKLNERR